MYACILKVLPLFLNLITSSFTKVFVLGCPFCVVLYWYVCRVPSVHLMLTYAMRSVVGDSESSDDGEHDASLTTAMTSMSLDRSAKTFVASFHRWMTSVDSGLSQASADMYARHAARFVEALGGTVGGLARYVELAKKGGHLDELRKTHKPTSVKAALWGLRRAFAYVRLASMTELFAADFCRHAEERIGNWTVNMKADAARQRHRHREAEDDVVRKLIGLLPEFDGLSTVRDAVSTAERLASDGGGLATGGEFRRLRDYVLIEVARSNGQRSGAVLHMTVDEFDRSSAVHGHHVVHVACHKTSSTYGSARLVLSDETHRHAATLVTVRSGVVPRSCPYLFATASGGSLPASHLTTAMTEAFRRDGLVVSDRRGNACTITATRLRKAHIACARSAGRRPGDMYDLSRHMLHRLATQQASYDVADRNAQSVLVHTRMMEDTYRRRAPVASPAPPVPALREQPPATATPATAPVPIKLEQCDTDGAAAPAAAAAAVVAPIRHEQELVDVASAAATAAVAAVIGRGGKRRAPKSRRAGFTSDEVQMLTRLYPRKDRVFATQVTADAQFDAELRSLLDTFTVKQVTDRIRAIHRA